MLSSPYSSVVHELSHGDTDGGRLVSFELQDDTALKSFADVGSVDCSLIIFRRGHEVLFGFNLPRHNWELPGGKVEKDESAHDAALRELAEETGIEVGHVHLVARIAFMFGADEHQYIGAVFKADVEDDPTLVANDELVRFRWWDPSSELWEGLSTFDADLVRRCLTQN